MIIILLVIAVLIGIIIFLGMKLSQPQPTAVIEQTEEEVHDTADGTVRIMVEPNITVKNGTMQDLNFFNLNKDRLMSIKLYTAEDGEIKDLIYDSPKIATSEVIAGDLVDTSKLTKGNNEALAEVFYYDTEGNQIGQTNVRDLTIVYES